MYWIWIENNNSLKFCIFCKVFVDNPNLETSCEFIFMTTRKSTNYFSPIRSELATVKFSFFKITFKVFQGLPLIWKAIPDFKADFKTVFSWVSLANWFSIIFFIFICSFPDIHLFLINCNLFQRNCNVTICELFPPISAHSRIVSARFYLFTSRFY